MTTLPALDDLIAELSAAGELRDTQYALAMNGKVVAAASSGGATADSRFCIFSSTKPIFASVVWRLIDQGRLSLATRVAEIWPEFATHGKDAVTIEQLLLFTCGFPSPMISRAAIGSREARVAEMERWEREWEPGSRFAYHPFSAGWVLAEVVTRVTDLPHGEALRSLVLDPLGIANLDLGPSVEQQGDIRPIDYIGSAPFDVFAALTGEPASSHVTGELVDEEPNESFDIRQFSNDPVAISAGSPGGGAISDASSVALFYQALLHNPGDLWSPDLLTDATGRIRNTFPDALRLGSPANRSLGLIIDTGENPRLQVPEHDVDIEMHVFGPGVHPGTFGHGGGGGQIAFADPVSGISFGFLSNVIDLDAVGAMRNQHRIVAAALASLR